MADQIKRRRRDSLPDGKLPGDVMVSILIKLPIKSLLKFQAVSKSWSSLISSTHFFDLHLRRQSVVAPNNCLLSLTDHSEDEDEDEFDRDDIEHLDLEPGLLDLTHHFNSSSAAEDDVFMFVKNYPGVEFDLSLLASCNGLVCMGGRFKSSSDVVLWNPATRRYRSLDVPKGYKLDFPTLGLCCVDDDDGTNGFKILVWNYRYPPFTVDTPYLYVYSLCSDSWDRFEFYAPKTKIEFKTPTFMGRSMHWLSHTCPKGSNCTCTSATEIVVFDVIDRARSCFRLPVRCGRHPLTMQQTLVIGGCLSVVIYNDVDAQGTGIGIWVMAEYGVENSWVKRFFIEEEEFTELKYPIVSWNDGEIVFNDEGDDSKQLVFVDLYSKNRRYVEFSAYHVLKFFKYVESLASVEPVVGEEGDSSSEEGDSNDSS